MTKYCDNIILWDLWLLPTLRSASIFNTQQVLWGYILYIKNQNSMCPAKTFRFFITQREYFIKNIIRIRDYGRIGNILRKNTSDFQLQIYFPLNVQKREGISSWCHLLCKKTRRRKKKKTFLLTANVTVKKL